MSIRQIVIFGCIASFVLSVMGAMVAEKKIIYSFKETDPANRSNLNLAVLGIGLIEILPVSMLILTLIILMKY